MTTEKLLQNFANASGIIMDHTLRPPRVLGQAFIVSKSRLVTCAGSIFNYADAPWGLSVNFCHPGIVVGVKSIALHPDFDRKEARKTYLSQTAVSKYSYPVQFNDLATMIMQPEIKDAQPEEIMQLHKALSVPFSREGVEISGALKEGELVEVVKKLLASKRQGLLTLYDELNIPLAYIQLEGGGIERVYFQSIVGEMAFAELIYRLPAYGFAFQPNYNFAWGDIRKIEMSAQDLVSESIRRAHELPGIISQLGGSRACYQRVVKEFSVESFNQNVQWLVANLWRTIDGYITIDQLSQRVGADTYTMAQGLRELANRGVVSLLNKTTPFHLSGQLGTAIVSHTDFDINPGDALKAFYLDPLSGAPCWQDGEFGGVASVLQPKNLLHSIPLYLRVPGALVLKNYRLIGLHNGPVQLKAGQSGGERQLFQMMWIGALFDMGNKKLRSVGEGSDDADDSQTKLTGLRVRDEEEIKVTAEKSEKYICAACYASNTQLGNCFNCGASLKISPVEVAQEGFFVQKLPIKFVSDLQQKYKVSDQKTFVALGAIAVLFFLLLVVMMSVSRTSQTPVHIAAPVNKKDSEQAVKLATYSVGLKGTAPPGYWFEDTMAITNPLPSFGIYSESSNQKIIFVIFNDMSPVQALDRFIQIPPFSDVVVNPALPSQKVIEGSQIIGEGPFHYYVTNYSTANDVLKTMLIGSFAAREPGKGILVLAQTLNPGILDYKSTLFLIDNMAEPLTKSANARKLAVSADVHNDGLTTGNENKMANTNSQSTASSGQKTSSQSSSESLNQSDNKLATEEELNKYCEVLQEKLQKRIQQSSDLQEIINKRKSGKLKIILDVDLSKEGQLRKMEIAEPDVVQKVNDAFVKIVKANSPYENVPRTESGLLSLRIEMNKSGDIKVLLP